MSDQPLSDQSQILANKVNDFLTENKLKLVPTLSFPIYNQHPVDLQLALEVIQKHEPQFGFSVILEEAENKPKAE